ncbi:beta-galactosidase [Mahella sp.]|uniref:beta-galactosidase n=1 Tax=Mahella sp. TaxID=2798721 RepID=UPI0025C51AC6|nr:beta-galactosidase [Mahella sp.]MBZ4665295.1 glycosyl hydrolase [Mahella sp.]
MVEIKRKQILLNGQPMLIMSGEIHYFRLKRDDWQDRIDKLKAAGCNAVASYVPWLCHETLEGRIDLEGRIYTQLDLGGFIDLCKANGLYFIVRPGPFIMAEMKNEGLPYWIYDKHPEILPISWDGKTVPTKTVDYMAPSFLREVKKWYSAVMSIVAPRLYTKGGNIIAVQLDNEVGMLSWVSNSPDLTDNVIVNFRAWLERRYDRSIIRQRYPFDIGDINLFIKSIRSPSERYVLELMHDMGYYMRDRFARYIAILRSYAEEFGVKDIPFIINIHGTGRGRGLTFPIGISQLYKTYTQSAGYLAASDHYLGELTMKNFQDLYLMNAFMDAMNREEQPLTSMEFECGNGDYDCTYNGRYSPAAADLKTRICIAQGNRMLNYYLFAGGTNYRLEPEPDDGNGRIAFTGERHGFAAPVGPEGQIDYTYSRLANIVKMMTAMSYKFSSMIEEHDRISFAFIPDYYMTEYHYPSSTKARKMVENLEAHRAGKAWEVMARAMLLSGYRFGAIDIQNKFIDPRTTPALALPSALYMDAAVQYKLVEYMRNGGNILLYGQVPLFDMEGQNCTRLADALGIISEEIRSAHGHYYLSVYADGWARSRPEVRVSFAQIFKSKAVKPILRVYGTDDICGFEATVGRGKAIVIATDYVCDISFFKTALKRLGIAPALTHDYPYGGIFMTTTITPDNERFLHIINLDEFDKEFCIYENGLPLFGGSKVSIASKDGLILPIGVIVKDTEVVYSTAEIEGIGEGFMDFRLTNDKAIIALRTDRYIIPHDSYKIDFNDEMAFVTPSNFNIYGKRLRIYLKQ